MAEQAVKKAEESKASAAAGGTGGAAYGAFFRPKAIPAVPDELLPSNKILFVQHLSTDVTEEILNGFFRHYPGFREIRTVPARKDIAFVEFETDFQATVARDATNGFPILPDQLVKVSFARK